MTSVLQILPFEHVHRLGWMLLHSLWQMAIVGVAVAFMLGILRRRSANLRYVVACGGLTAMFLSALATYYLLPRAASPAIAFASAPEPALAPAVPMPVDSTSRAADLSPRNAPAIALAEPHVSADIPPNMSSISANASAAPALLDRATALLAPYVPWTVPLWLLGVTCLSLWHLGGYVVARRLRLQGVSPAPQAWTRIFDELKTKMGVKRSAQLLQTILVEVPVVIGWLRPAVLVPVTALTGLAPHEIEALLAHELAHVRRCDYLVNLLQTVFETLFFYHPAVWWISRRIRIEREFCCDDAAVAVCGDSVSLGEALTSLAAARRQIKPALAATGGSLVERLRRILGRQPEGPNRHYAWLAGLLLAGIILAGTFALGGAARESSSQVEIAFWTAIVDEETAGQLMDKKSLTLEMQENGRKMDGSQLLKIVRDAELRANAIFPADKMQWADPLSAQEKRFPSPKILSESSSKTWHVPKIGPPMLTYSMSWSCTLFYRMEPGKDFAKLEMTNRSGSGVLQIIEQSQKVRSFQAPASTGNEKTSTERLAENQALVYFTPMKGASKEVYYSILVLQAVRVPKDQLECVRSFTDAPKWIAGGLDGVLGDIRAAKDWELRNGAMKEPPTPAGAVYSTADGVKVEIVAIGQPTRWAYHWWNAEGTPIQGDPSWQKYAFAGSRLAVVTALKNPSGQLKFDLQLPSFLGNLGGGIAGCNSPSGKSFEILCAGLGDNERKMQDYLEKNDRFELVVNHGKGEWTEITTLKEGQEVHADGGRFHLKQVREVFKKAANRSGLVLIDGDYDYDPNVEVAIAAVDSQGKRTEMNTSIGSGSNQAKGRRWYTHLRVDKADIDHFAILQRPMVEHVFKNLPAAPKVVPETASTAFQGKNPGTTEETIPVNPNAEHADELKDPASDQWIAEHLHDANLAEQFPAIARRTSRQTPRRAAITAALWRELEKKPDPQLALNLALVLHNQFDSQLHVFVPGKDGDLYTYTWREFEGANFPAIAKALMLGFEHAEKGTEMWKKLGIGLAKLRLAQGDWAGMNQMLEQLGYATIPEQDRPFLAPPPSTWLETPGVQWTRTDESMQSGNCGLSFRFEKGGKPLPGVHVCVRERPIPPDAFYSGRWPPRGLGHFIERTIWSFGSVDTPEIQAKTRYAVSGPDGVVRFDKLPNIPIEFEIAMLTAKFPEPGRGWTFEVDPVPPDKAKHFWKGDWPEQVTDWMSAVNLEPGKNVEYPRIVVYPMVDLNIDDNTEIEAAAAESFALSWPAPPGYREGELTYTVEMGEYKDPSDPGLKPNPYYFVNPTKKTVRTTRLEIGKEGIGGKPLEPGTTVYGFQVTARDSKGQIVAQPEIRRLRIRPPAQSSDEKSQPSLGVSADTATAPPNDAKPVESEETKASISPTTDYTLTQVLDGISKRDRKFSPARFRIEYRRTVNDQLSKGSRTEYNTLLSQWRSCREDARREPNGEILTTRLKLYDQRVSINPYRIDLDSASQKADGSRHLHLHAHNESHSIENTLGPQILGIAAHEIDWWRRVEKAGTLRIENRKVGDIDCVVLASHGGDELVLAPQFDWAPVKYGKTTATDFHKYGDFWMPTKIELVLNASSPSEPHFWQYQDTLEITSVKTGDAAGFAWLAGEPNPFAWPKPQPGDRVDIAYPRWDPAFGREPLEARTIGEAVKPVEAQAIRDAVKAEHSFRWQDPLPEKDALLWMISQRWLNAFEVKLAISPDPAAEQAGNRYNAPLPFLALDQKNVDWAVYDLRQKWLMRLDSLPEKESIQKDGLSCESGFAVENVPTEIGKPIETTFYVKNTGDKPIYLVLGGDQRSVRSYRFRFAGIDAGGFPVPDPYEHVDHHGGMQGPPREIKPDETYRETLRLDKWLKFDHPGEYRVYASRTLEFAQDGTLDSLRGPYRLVHPLHTAFPLNIKPSAVHAKDALETANEPEPAWGRLVRDVRARLSVEREPWNAAESPPFVLKVENTCSAEELPIQPVGLEGLDNFLIEIDGKSYPLMRTTTSNRAVYASGSPGSETVKHEFTFRLCRKDGQLTLKHIAPREKGHGDSLIDEYTLFENRSKEKSDSSTPRRRSIRVAVPIIGSSSFPATDENGQTLYAWTEPVALEITKMDTDEKAAANNPTEPKASLSLEVRVVDPAGKPVEKSTIDFWKPITADQRSKLAESPMTGGDRYDLWQDTATGQWWQEIGKFATGDRATRDEIPPGKYRVTAFEGHSGPDTIGKSRVIELDGSVKLTTVTVPLENGPSLKIQCLNKQTGKPVEGVAIVLVGNDGFPRKVFAKESQYIFKRLRPGKYQLKVNKTAYYDSQPNFAMAEDDPAKTVVIKPGSDITLSIRLQPSYLSKEEADNRWPWAVTGTVTDPAGKPIAGAVVRAHCGYGTLFPTGETTSDAQGRYLLRFGPGMHGWDDQKKRWYVNLQAANISVSKAGFARSQSDRQMADEMPPQDNAWNAKSEEIILPHKPRQLNFIMAPATTIEGKVTDAAGKPIAGATVEWGYCSDPSEKLQRTSTDEQGRYRLDSSKYGVSYRLSVSAPGMAPQWKVFFPGWFMLGDLRRSDEEAVPPEKADFQMEPSHRLEGVVVDQQGKPIPRVKIEARTAVEGFHSSFSMPSDPLPIPGKEKFETATDDRGRFLLEGMPAEQVQLHLDAPHRHVNDQNYAVDREHRIVMSGSGRAGILRAEVIDRQTRKPVPEFTVALRYNPEPWTNRDENGQFDWQDGVTEGGKYFLYIYSKDYAPAVAELLAMPLDSEKRTTVELVPAPPLVGQIVAAQSGKPLPGVRILYAVRDEKNRNHFEWPERERYIDGSGSFSAVQRAVTRDEGKFWFCEYADQKGTLFILAPGYERLIHAPEDRPATSEERPTAIRLYPEATISGTLLKSGRSQADAELSVWKTASGRIEETFEKAKTDSEGRFHFGNLAPGEYRISYWSHPSRNTAVSNRLATVTLVRGQQQVIEPIDIEKLNEKSKKRTNEE